MIRKDFEVAEYKLPLIDGKISVESSVPFSAGKVPITADVAYTFGGDASGNATITISKYGNNVFKQAFTIESGSKTIEVDIVNDLQMSSGQYGYFEVTFTFEDPLTGSKVTDSKSFSVQPFVYSIYANGDRFITPGSPYKFTITVKKFDGSPAPAGTKVQIIPENPNTIPQQTLTLGTGGSVSSSVNVPKNVQYISIRITTKDSYDGYIGASIPYVRSGSFLTIDILTEK